jgi:succinate dehydrogenase / fumarate reductase, cytochrome b subunit
MARRPLSPHLTIYRFAYTMSLSILHRITGIGLAAGLVVLALWLTAVAQGEDAYQRFTDGRAAPLLRVLLGLWLVAFLYHFANGIRHLAWDAGFGLERAQARRSARVVIVAVSVAAALLLWAFFFRSAQ